MVVMFMIAIESDCVDCDLPCIYEACRHYRTVHYYCDKCGEEDIIYEFNDEQLCLDCILKKLERVEYDG